MYTTKQPRRAVLRERVVVKLARSWRRCGRCGCATEVKARCVGIYLLVELVGVTY